MNRTRLYVNDPGFFRIAYDWTDVVGWRLYNMTRNGTAATIHHPQRPQGDQRGSPATEEEDTSSTQHGWYGPGPVPWLGAEEQPRFPANAIAAAHASDIDWVARGAVTPPISQGRCGTCAQFSATANVEAQWHLAGGHPLTALAVQEMIDCSSYSGPYGMGWVATIHHGLDLATDYPLANHSDPTLKGCRSPCDTAAANKSFAHIDGATCTKAQDAQGNADEDQMLAWLQHGPLSISVAAGPLNGYGKGGYIMNGSTCNNTHVDHAVLVVGQGVDQASGMRYWKLKNSWGPGFGEGGYFRVQHGVHCLSMRGACQSYIGKPPGALKTLPPSPTAAAAAAAVAITSPTFFGNLHQPDPTCSTGILRSSSSTTPGPSTPPGTCCCAKSCGTCGGARCQDKPGGAANCCCGTIANNGHFCNTEPPPCTMGNAPTTPSVRNPKRGYVADGGANLTCDDAVLLNVSGWFYDYNLKNGYRETTKGDCALANRTADLDQR